MWNGGVVAMSLAKWRKEVCSLSAGKRFKGAWCEAPAYRYSVYITPIRAFHTLRYEKSAEICAKDIFSIIIAFIIQFHLLTVCVYTYECVSASLSLSLYLPVIRISQTLIESKAVNTKFFSHSKRCSMKFNKRKTAPKKRKEILFLFLCIWKPKPPNQYVTYGNANETNKMIIIPFIHLKSSHFHPHPARSRNLNKWLWQPVFNSYFTFATFKWSVQLTF